MIGDLLRVQPRSGLQLTWPQPELDLDGRRAELS